MRKSCGIYKIENIITNDCYVGQSINLKKRIREHLYCLQRDKHKNKYLQNAFNKYGKDNFVFNIVLLCEGFELTYYEQNLVNSINPKYNICRECVDSSKGIIRSDEMKEKCSRAKIGNSYCLGKTASLEARKNMSEAHKGHHNFSNEYKEKLSKKMIGNNYALGNHLSEETRRKMSESRTGEKNCNFGKNMPQETRDKISNSHKGKKVSDKTREKLSIIRKGKKNSNETRKKISISLKGKPKTQEAKQNMSNCRMGKTFSDEHKKNISNAIKKKWEELRKSNDC